MVKKITAEHVNDKDVIIAFDLKSVNYNIDNIKALLETFDLMVKDYNYNGRIILFDNKIQMEFNINNMDSLDNFVLQVCKDNSDYSCVTDYANSKKEEGWDIFSVYCITDGTGILPEKNYEEPFIWVIGNYDLELPFGTII